MTNTPFEKFNKGYGQSAYEHAKLKKHGEKETWTAEDKETKDLREKEYKKRLEKFQKSKLQLQEIKQLKNIEGTYKIEKGDTFYPVLKDFFGMNDHTAFFAMVRMLEHGINVDLWKPGDSITLLANGTLKVEREKKVIEIKNLLKPQPVSAPVGKSPGEKQKPAPAGKGPKEQEQEPALVSLVQEPQPKRGEGPGVPPPEDVQPKPKEEPKKSDKPDKPKTESWRDRY